jgi:hypothetical protein
VSIALEELKDLGEPVDYDVQNISFSAMEQKEDWFIKVCCPLPGLLDPTDRHFPVDQP